MGAGLPLTAAFAEVVRGVWAARCASEIQGSGQALFEMGGYVDAQAEFDGIGAETVKAARDINACVRALAAREMLDRGQLRRLAWVGALDMRGALSTARP